MTKGTPNAGINGTLANGLLAHWCFNDGSLQDISGNGNDLSGVFVEAEDKDGQPNQALYFNNKRDVGKNGFPYPSGHIVNISFWFKASDITSNQILFSLGDLFTGQAISIRKGKMENGSTYGVTSSVNVNANEWINICVKINKQTNIVNWYKNGIFISNNPTASINSWGNIFSLGWSGNWNYPHDFLGGVIDEFRFYGRDLTDSEIAEIFAMGANYQADIEPPTFNTINISDMSNVSTKLNINCNENATAYYKILNSIDIEPTPLQLKNSHDGMINLTADTTIQTVISLNEDQNYKLAVVAEDSYNNLQNNITVIKLDITPPIFNTINISNITYNSIKLNVNCNENATIYLKLLSRNKPSPSSIEVKQYNGGSLSVSENTLSDIGLGGLLELTEYSLYVVAEDSVGNLQASPTRIDFSTIANDKNIKLDLGMFSDVLSPAYYNGFFKSLDEKGFTGKNDNDIFLNPNILPKIYEYGIEKNGESITYNLQIPLLPQEEKIIWIENYISPTSDTFKFSGYISDLDKYYGKYSSIQYAKEFKNINDINDRPYPFLLITDKIYNDDNGNIIYKDFNNSNIEFSFLPSEKEEYKSKIVLKNTYSEQTNRKEINIINIIATNLEVSIADYYDIKIGNVLKIKEIKNTSSPFYNIYKSNYDVKYKIISKIIDGNKFYITLDKVYPYYKKDSKYITPELYSENIIELNYLSIRGNPIISKTGEYEIKDTGSIDRYGDKVYKISSSIFPLSYYEKLGKTIINERKSVNKISNTNYEYKKEYTKFVAEFTIEHYLLNIGDLIYITEDYYYHIDNEPFQVIGIDRQNTGTERSAKIIALSCKPLKDYTYNNVFKEVEASNIKSISSLDPTDYLTDKNILATRYTTQFGESYSSIGKTANIIDKIDKSVKFNISNFTNIDTSNLVFAINDIYYQTVLIEQDDIYLTFLLISDKEDNINKVKVGDIAYIYNNELSTNKALTVLSYQSSRSSNKLFFSYDLKDVYDSVIIRVYESDDYDSATMLSNTDEPTLIVQTQTRENKILIGNTGNCNLKYDIKPDKYYTIHLTIVSLQEDLYPQEKITIYTPTNSYTIDYTKEED